MMYVYHVSLVDDGSGGLRPDIPDGIPFSSISNGAPMLIVKTLTEVPGLTPLTREEAAAEVVAMGFDAEVLDRCGLGGEV
jgi:hypothetical protein